VFFECRFTEVGTAKFKAPEIAGGGEGYTNSVDVFSFGRCMWQVLCRANFPTNTDEVVE